MKEHKVSYEKEKQSTKVQNPRHMCESYGIMRN